MISGALEIISGVDAGVVNPLLLPAVQGEEKFSYIVITYDDFPDVFDILFLHGTHVDEFVSLHHELRALMGVQSVQMILSACNARCRVSLFSVSRQCFERFLRTFYCEPTLNVVIDRLSRNQVSGLLLDSGCRNGILEVDRAGLHFPQIEITRFHTAEELLSEASRFRRGRLILYDLELNSAIRQRAELLQGGAPGTGPALDLADPPSGDPPPSAQVDVKEPPPPPSGGPAPGPPPPVQASPAAEESVIAPLFRNVLREFTGAVSREYGIRLDEKMKRLLCRVFDCPVGFDPALIVETNAVNVLAVIEQGVDLGWSFRRKRLRSRALEIIRDLYESHNEVLRRCGVEERVQECYRALET